MVFRFFATFLNGRVNICIMQVSGISDYLNEIWGDVHIIVMG